MRMGWYIDRIVFLKGPEVFLGDFIGSNEEPWGIGDLNWPQVWGQGELVGVSFAWKRDMKSGFQMDKVEAPDPDDLYLALCHECWAIARNIFAIFSEIKTLVLLMTVPIPPL